MPIAVNIIPPDDYLRECFDYNSENNTFIRKWRPRSHFATTRAWRSINTRDAGKPAGCANADGRVYVALNGVMYLRSRIIWKMTYGYDPPDEIDHIDRNPGNDRLSNLRLANSSQSKCNRSSKGNKTSGLKGVRKIGRRWYAAICVNYVQHSLGGFATPEVAHAAYVEAARRLHGDFAREG
jgi:hypothetical protein